MRLLIHNALAAAIVLLGPSLWLNRTFGRGFWEVGGFKVWALVAIAGTYALAAGGLAGYRRIAPTRLRQLAVAAVPIISVIAAPSLLDLDASRMTLGLAAVTAVALLVLLFGVPRYERVKAGVLVIALAAISSGHIAYGVGYLPRLAKVEAEEFTSRSTLYILQVRAFNQPVPRPLQSGGALALLWGDYLLATGEGKLYRYSDAAPDNTLDVRPLMLRVPTNPGAFREGVARLGLDEGWFRVADIHTVLDGDILHLYASHHYWYDEQRCFTVRLSAIELLRDEVDAAPADLPWTTLFETSPCLPVELPPDGRPFFKGLEIGGRIASYSPDTLLITLGDHEFDGVNAPGAFAQDTTVSYGKTFLIDLRTGAVERFTMGHRNPQGLFIDETRRIWSTEHGPRGGDELNQLVRGGNYGWPIVTYGVHYGTTVWPTNPRQGTHSGYDAPTYAWVPSIAVSAVLGISGRLFEQWSGDLIAGSLKDQALWRIRLVGDGVGYAERMDLGIHVRDVIEGHRGEIVVWNEQYPGPHLFFITPQINDRSAPAQFVQCTGCHDVGNGTEHGIGPDLTGIVGRRIASARGFAYSEALSALGGTWTEQNLDAFLRDPAAFAPGTAMRVPGIADPEHRREIIAYLLSLR